MDKHDVPDMPVELDLLDKLKGRVQLAKKIDKARHQVSKEKHAKNWMKKAAEAMDIELDSDFAYVFPTRRVIVKLTITRVWVLVQWVRRG